MTAKPESKRSSIFIEDYIFLMEIFGTITAVAVYLINKRLVKCVSLRQGLLQSMIIIFSTVILSYFLTYKEKRIVLQGLWAVVIGAGIYTLSIYKFFLPEICRFFCEMLVALVPVCAFIYLIYGKRSKKTYFKRIVNSLNLSRTIQGIVCLIACIILPAVYTHNMKLYKQHTLNKSVYEVNKVYGDECELACNTDRVKCLVDEEEWKNSELTVKQDAITAVIEYYAGYWGIPERFEIEFSDDLAYENKGSYSYRDHLICINNKALKNDSAEECLTTAIHEVRHSYQHYMSNVYKKLSPKERNLFAFNDVGGWVTNMGQYKTPESDEYESYIEYMCQPLERDARTISRNEANKLVDEINRLIINKK